jgi:hypothetical protein
MFEGYLILLPTVNLDKVILEMASFFFCQEVQHLQLPTSIILLLVRH